MVVVIVALCSSCFLKFKRKISHFITGKTKISLAFCSLIRTFANMKLSVIIPVYRVEDTLDRCVESVLCQSVDEMEVILVDDGSPDQCPAKCDLWAEKDARIRVIHKENGGLSDARNAGIDIAQGDFITFVDSDDYLEADTWQAATAAMAGRCRHRGIFHQRQAHTDRLHLYGHGRILAEGTGLQAHLCLEQDISKEAVRDGALPQGKGL